MKNIEIPNIVPASAELSTSLKDSENVSLMLETQKGIVQALRVMNEASLKESKAQHYRFLLETFLSIIAILVSAVAALASVASLNPVLARVLREIIS